MEASLIEKIIAVSGLCLWLIFPFGMFISVIMQNREAMPSPELFEDPFAGVKIETEKEFEEPRIDDFSHHHVSLNPGPDHSHTNI